MDTMDDSSRVQDADSSGVRPHLPPLALLLVLVRERGRRQGRASGPGWLSGGLPCGARPCCMGGGSIEQVWGHLRAGVSALRQPHQGRAEACLGCLRERPQAEMLAAGDAPAGAVTVAFPLRGGEAKSLDEQLALSGGSATTTATLVMKRTSMPVVALPAETGLRGPAIRPRRHRFQRPDPAQPIRLLPEEPRHPRQHQRCVTRSGRPTFALPITTVPSCHRSPDDQPGAFWRPRE